MTSNVWTLGKTWNVHVKHEDGRWIRVTGIPTEVEAHWMEADLREKLLAEAAE